MSPEDARKMLEYEISAAERGYGPFRSTHEGFGVLSEEVEELLTVIRLNRRSLIEREALQVAAVAFRIATSLENAETRERSRAK